MITSKTQLTSVSPKVNGGAQLLRVKSSGAVALWDGQSAYAVIVAEGQYTGDIGEAVHFTVKGSKYDLDAFESFTGKVTLEDHGLAWAGEESAAIPTPEVKEEEEEEVPHNEFLGFLGQETDEDPLEALDHKTIIESIFNIMPPQVEDEEDESFPLLGDGKLYDEDPPENRLN